MLTNKFCSILFRKYIQKILNDWKLKKNRNNIDSTMIIVFFSLSLFVIQSFSHRSNRYQHQSIRTVYSWKKQTNKQTDKQPESKGNIEIHRIEEKMIQ